MMTADESPRRTRAESQATNTGSLNPEFVLIRDGYHVRIVDGAHALKTQTARLIERMYASRGLWAYGDDDDPAESQTTIVATRKDRLVATLTLGLDTERGLRADTLYHHEIETVRKAGGRACEITRLAMDPEHGSREALAGMFQILYVLARMIHEVTDVFIEVHPRHVGFYQRLLGYRVAGPERVCPRVGGAPAVLLHLSQKKLDHILSLPSEQRGLSSRSFYRLFPTAAELHSLRTELVRFKHLGTALRTSA